MYSRRMDGKENIRKDIIVVSFVVILITSVFCGCQSNQVKEDYKAIFKIYELIRSPMINIYIFSFYSIFLGGIKNARGPRYQKRHRSFCEK